METIAAAIPSPIHMSGTDLLHRLAELGVALAALNMGLEKQIDATVPDQWLLSNAIVVQLTLQDRPTTPQPAIAPPQPNPQLLALEKMAKTNPAFRRHRAFWQALRAARNGARLSQRQRQVLDIGWRLLNSKSRNAQWTTRQTQRPTEILRLQPFRQQARSATQPGLTYNTWHTLQGGAQLGNVRLDKLTPDRANPAPTRDDSWLPKMKLIPSDTDSGDE